MISEVLHHGDPSSVSAFCSSVTVYETELSIVSFHCDWT